MIDMFNIVERNPIQNPLSITLYKKEELNPPTKPDWFGFTPYAELYRGFYICRTDETEEQRGQLLFSIRTKELDLPPLTRGLRSRFTKLEMAKAEIDKFHDEEARKKASDSIGTGVPNG